MIESSETTFKHKLESPIGGKVSEYFMRVFQLLWANQSMRADVLYLSYTYPDYELWIAGHSLGGALAALALAHVSAGSPTIYNPTRPLRLMTMGQPRTG